MAKGKVKKGFGSYLFVLFLAIIATFLVLITVMLFSPFKNILGFKYFAFKESKIITEIDAKEEEKFDFSTIDKININCNFAKVKVERAYNIDDYAFKFENNLSGFARSDQDTDFTYEINYTDASKNEIDVKVHEPEGFLYFNKNLTISVLISTKKTYSLDNTEININNTKGDVLIGNVTKTVNIEGQNDANYITIGSLNVKTTSGDVTILPYTNSNIGKLFIKTNSGRITSNINLNLAYSWALYSNKGRIEFKEVTLNQYTAKLDLNNSKFYAEKISANAELYMKDGYFDVDIYNGDLSSNDALDQLSVGEINIKEYEGNLSLPYANASKINIKEVKADSEIYIHAKKGDINIGKLYADVAKIETTSGDVKIHSYGKDVDVKTTSGKINVTFDSDEIANSLDLQSKTGTVNLKVKSSLGFNLNVVDTNDQTRKDSKINIEWLDEVPDMPYGVNGGGKDINIKTNAKINISLI